uniref:Uncharacterized protein n=1 Tax=Triticum urartu TaxID=4572 RepID=A0A8R7QZT7_TRIUA
MFCHGSALAGQRASLIYSICVGSSNVSCVRVSRHTATASRIIPWPPACAHKAWLPLRCSY